MKKLKSFAGLCAALLIPAAVWTHSSQRLKVEGRPLWPSKDETPSAPRGQIPRSEKLRLAGLLRELCLMHDNADPPLSKAQCRTILAMLKPRLRRSQMTDDEAYKLNTALRKLMTTPQSVVLEHLRRQRMVFLPILDREQEEELAREEKPMLAYLSAFNPIRPLVKDKTFARLPEPLRQRIASRCELNARLFVLLKATSHAG